MLVVADETVIRPDLQQVFPRPRLLNISTTGSYDSGGAGRESALFVSFEPSIPNRIDVDSHARMVQYGSLGRRLVLFLEHDPFSLQLVVHVRDIVHIRDDVSFEIELVQDIGGEITEMRFSRMSLRGGHGETGDSVRLIVVIIHVRDLGESRRRLGLMRSYMQVTTRSVSIMPSRSS